MSRRDIRKPLSFLLFLLLLGGAQTGWGQSLIPSTPGNYLQVTGSAATGDNDTFMVVFFSVPDDTSGPLYFAIDDPYLSGTSPDDGTDTAGGDSWDFYLVGGSGTFSSPISRQVTFGDIGEAANGSTLEELKFDGDGGGDNGWHYFSGVSPTQGEHIGNQYYFKVVAEAPNTDKNAFRLNVSKTDSGDPTGIAGVRAFAYAWTLALLNNTGRTWELYPFVPDSATGNITAFFVDFDNQDQGSVYNKTDRTTALASNLGNAATDSYSTAVTGQTNGTWYVELTETNGFPAINTALFYAEGSSPAEAYRVYASDYFPAAPDHVSATAEDGSAISNGSDLERVLLQLVDDSGDAVPYVRNIYLSVDGSAEIEATSDEAGLLNATERVVTTDSEGFAWVDVSDTVAENVTLTVITDGTTGVASQSLTSSRLPSSGSLGVNDAPQLSFIADAYPTASSAFGTSFIEGATQAIAAITIAEAGSFPSITAADGIRITIPTSKDVTFNTTPSSLSLSVSNGGGTVSYDNSNKTAVINVDTDFGTIDSLTVSGLELTAAADSDTSFFLEFSFDGDLVAEVSDNKLIIVQDTASTYTWTGSNTTWADQTNWDSGDGTAGDDGYPGESVITDNVVIPGGLSNYPVLASAVTINDLSIGSGGELDIGSTVLTVNGDSSNDGRLILSGAAGQGTGLGSFDTDSGTIEYSGGGSVQLDNCYNIEFSSGTYTLASDLTVKGDMTISGATVEDGGQAISISGDWNLSSGTFSANSDSGGTGTVEFVGSSIASLSGDTSFYNLTVQRAGKIIKFGAGDAFTVDGTLYVVGVAGNLINLISSNPETQWTITNGGGSETVQYVEVEDSAVGGTNDIAAYYSIDGDRNDTTSPGWNFFGTAWTWTGSISSAWGDEGNWDSGDESAGNDGTPGAGDSVTIPFTSRDPQLTGAVTVDDLTIEAWVEFDLNDYDLTVSGTLTNVGTLRAEGGGSVTASLNTDSGSVEYYGTGSYSHLAFGNSYYDLTISGGGSYALGAALTVENDLTVSSGTLDASGGADLLLGGDVDFSGGTFSKGTGTFTLQAADAQSLDPNAQDLGAFLVAGSGTAVTPSGDLIVDSLTIDSGASLTIGTGISIDVGSGALTNAGTLISSGAITAGDFSSTGTFTNAAANTISASGDVVISGSFGGTSTDNTLTMSGDGTRLDASENLGNLSVDPGSGNTVSLANNALVLDGDLAINSGSLNVEGFGITVSGSFSNSDTLGFAGGESTVSLPSSPIPGTVHYYGNSNTTGLVGGNSYTDLLFENSVDATSVTWTLSADLSVSDTLTVGSSTTLSTSTAWNNVTVSGDVDVSSGTFDAGGSGTIKVGGDVSFGTLTGGSGSTLELDGSSAQAIVPNGQSFGAVSLSGSGGVTLSGTGSFQSLTIAGGESLTLGGGAVTTGLTVNGTVTNGGSLYLNSDDAGGPTSLYMADGTTIANSGVLQVVSSTGAVELSSPGTTTLTGNELDVNGESLNLGGFETAIDHTLGAGDAVTLVGDVSFSGTLTLNGTGASLTTGDNTLTTGSLTITEGTVAVSGSGDVDVGSGAVTVGASGELTFNTTGSPALISGDFTSSGTVNNSQTSLVRASGNVEIDGSFGTPANSTVEMSGASATINTVVQAGSLETSGSAG
ncbi:beta strand repeat-containing protein [Sediminispirochaeta smaragdinae]|nr:hypothetical protein [Sediminispirochaeta smaragdinae]